MGRGDHGQAHQFPLLLIGTSIAVVPFLALFTAEKTVRGEHFELARADLTDAQLTPRPKDWKPFEIWLRDYRRELKAETVDQDPLIPTDDEIARWKLVVSALESPEFDDVDFKHADLSGAFLAGASLNRTKLQNAKLIGAKLQGSSLLNANLSGASMVNANLLGAALPFADLSDANMIGANAWRATFVAAIMQRTNFRRAKLTGAEFFGVSIVSADLAKADMRRADLSGTRLRILADKGGAAGVIFGEILSAYSSAKFLLSDVSEVNFSESECGKAVFWASIADSAIVECSEGTLVQEQLLHTVGNRETKLPEGLWIWSCLPRDDPKIVPDDYMTQITKLLDFHPDEKSAARISRSEFEDRLFCDDDEKPLKINGDRTFD